MSTNIVNQMPYLRTSRNFPEDLHQLTVEVNKSYVDIANFVNSRTIGVFPINRPAITGESWFVNKAQRQQTFRQVYTFTSTANIPHNIDFNDLSMFTRMYGQFTDDATGNWYGIISSSNVSIIGQRSFYLTPTDIVFLAGAGAPTLSSGNIVLEWLSVRPNSNVL